MLKILIFFSLFLGFFLLFREVRLLETAVRLLRRTQAGMDMSARQRSLEGRKQLLKLQEGHSLLNRLEKKLYYSGLKWRFPNLTVELWLAGNLAVAAFLFLSLTAVLGMFRALAVLLVLGVLEEAFLRYLRLLNLRVVDEDMMKLLDFLGNYSIVAGEVTGVFRQIGRYMREPVRTALEQCCFETQVTGEPGPALLSMAEKVEHPKFQELARNLEISIRYCADLTALVNGSRRSVREHLRTSRERRGMLREAAVNMLLLLVMSVAVLLTVGHLIDVPMRALLWDTVPGKLGLALLVLIFLLFLGQVQRVHG